MARKRLSPARPDIFSLELSGAAGPRRSEAPISSVAGDSAAAAALSELSEEMRAAREGGRFVLELPLDAIETGYLVRDRIEAAPEEMETLVRSIAERGQQTPIEVVPLDRPDGSAQDAEKDPGKAPRYGLISGWRRLLALRRLAEEGTPRPVLALVRRPEDRAAAWQAMVEENEIRADLSFYERARIVARAVESGVFDGDKAALQGLFPHVSYARRSKIKSFLALVAAFDGLLRHPARITERQGLALAKALAEDPQAAARGRAALETANEGSGDRDAEAEARLLARAVAPPAAPVPDPVPAEDPERIGTIELRQRRGRVELSGAGLTPEFLDRLRAWIAAG